MTTGLDLTGIIGAVVGLGVLLFIFNLFTGGGGGGFNPFGFLF